jgi:Na+/H+-dicarboxylate symporter
MPPPTPRVPRRNIFRQLYAQVVVAVVAGIIIGYFFPKTGVALKPLGDGFIWLIRQLLAPIVFGTIVAGIARMGSLREAGRIGLKALVYFEVVSSLALLIGLVVVNVARPGAGMNVDARKLDTKDVAGYVASATPANGAENSAAGVAREVGKILARNFILQVILASLVAGAALSYFRAPKLLDFIEAALRALFIVVGWIMRLAPLAAFGGMAFTVGMYGLASLASLGQLLAAVYLTCLIFIFGVLGLIARACGFSLWKFLRYIREEIVIVFATASTEAVLPRMMVKMENVGCAREVVGLVLPAGYTFNPDGTAIYLTMAAIFIAQATNTPLTFGDQLLVLAVLMLTSKGSAGVAGAGFVALAATLSSLDKIPVAGLMLIFGVDRFLNQARAMTNLIGNGVATMAIARWEKSLDRQRAAEVLDQK